MHTDEYEICLARELAVCADYIKKCRLRLKEMESRHGMTTEVFLEQVRLCSGKGCIDWKSICEEFERWKLKHHEYRQLLDSMKI